jgi:hypothetical protein
LVGGCHGNDYGPINRDRNGEFPELKVWNHGKISGDLLKTRLAEYTGSNIAFLVRMKDKTTFTLGIKFPDHIEGECSSASVRVSGLRRGIACRCGLCCVDYVVWIMLCGLCCVDIHNDREALA